MKNVLIVFACLFSFAIAQAQNTQPSKSQMDSSRSTATETRIVNGSLFKSQVDSLSYAIGVMWAQNLKQQGITEVNTDAVAAAMKDVYANKPGIMDVKAANQFFRGCMNEIKMEATKKNQEAGKKFLDANAKRQGVITLPSGLQYEILREGGGKIPKASDKVSVHYHGTLIDGTVFDSSVQRGEPTSFPVTGVIKGWVEALQLMPVGSKWKLFIPSDLAYGERGAGGQIGPYATLVFEVELLGIE